MVCETGDMVDDAAERAELTAFCVREHPRLVGALSLYCGDRDLAAELAQEALIRAVRDWGRVGQMAAPGAWVHRVAMNLAGSWFRRRGAERRAYGRLGPDETTVDGDIDHDASAVRHAVAGLPERQRRVVVLRFYLGMTVAQAADSLGISQEATAALTYRAVQALRARLGEDELEVASDAR